MLIFTFFNWWFIDGWFGQFKKIGTRMAGISGAFSVGTLLETMFSPWKQIISDAGPDNAIGMKFRAMIDNLVSRFIGFFIRLFVLITGVLFIIGVFVLSLIFALAWPLLPLMPLVLIFLSMDSL